YYSGAAQLRNMVCRTQGGVLKRAGTEFIAEALDQAKPSRLICFKFSVQQVYILEFSDYRFRVFKDGGIVTYPAGHAKAGQQVVIETPYSSDDMQRVRVAQTEDVMVFTHPNHEPRQLVRRQLHHQWEFERLSFGTSIDPPDWIKLDKDGRNGASYVVSAVSDNDEESLQSDTKTGEKATGTSIGVPIYEEMMFDQCYSWYIQNGYEFPPEWDIFSHKKDNRWIVFSYLYGVLKFSYPIIDFGSSATYYDTTAPNGKRIKRMTNEPWFDTAVEYTEKGYGGVLQELRKRIEEYVTEHNEKAISDGHNILSWKAVPNAVRYRVYRSRQTEAGEMFCLLGTTTATTFDDDNLAFASLETPQETNEPFSGNGNYPGVCAFHQQRLILARTNNKPSTVWGSRVGAHRNFNRNQTTDDDGNNIGAISDTSSFEHTLQADDSNEILWIVPMSDLLIGTTGGEFRMSSNGFIITPTNVSAKRQSNYGCSAITPVLVGQAVMGVGHKNRVLRAYKWDYSGDAYRGSNVSHYAGHLFNGRKIVDIAHQYEPESILWVVMSDGALLSMTYMDEEQVLGWSRNDTDGRFEACVTNIAADGSDEIWFIVAREVKGKTVRYIERMKNVMYDGEDIRNAWYLDSALEYRGTPTEVLRGLAHLEGKTVSCFADGAVHADLKVMNGAVTLTEKVSRAVVGLPFTAELETMDLEPIQG
ncbi:MAG: hypothetical protein LIP18_01405, partial [Planctomycetes bacterium]|nr:hypothetical protein [Planctomycetota bacterium]